MHTQTRKNFKADILALFRGERGGHVEKYLYTHTPYEQDGMSGAGLINSFNRSSPFYYIGPDTERMIPDVASAIAPLTEDFEQVADFGCGGEASILTKTLPLIAGCPNAKLYTAIDFSRGNLAAARTTLQSRRPDLEVKTIKADFFQDTLNIPRDALLALLLGSTITNLEMRETDPLPKEQAVKALRHIKDQLPPGSLLLADYDSNQDPDSLLRGYDNLYSNRFVSNLAYLIDRELGPKGNFHPALWATHRVWNSREGVMHHCISALEDQDFSIDEERFQPRAGTRFVAINSVKFKEETFASITRCASYDSLPPIHSDAGRIVFQPLLT